MTEPSTPQNTVEPPSLPIGFNQKNSGLAKASFIIGIGSIVIWILAIVSLMVFIFKSIGISHKFDNADLVPFLAAGFLMLIGYLLNFVGLIFGIIEVRKSITNKWMAITGVSINGGVIVLSVGLHFMGHAFRHLRP